MYHQHHEEEEGEGFKGLLQESIFLIWYDLCSLAVEPIMSMDCENKALLGNSLKSYKDFKINCKYQKSIWNYMRYGVWLQIIN